MLDQEPTIDIRPLSDRTKLDHVWANLRATDRAELSLQNLTDDNYAERVMATPHKWVVATPASGGRGGPDADGRVMVAAGDPFGVFGAIERDRAFWVFWFSTDRIGDFMRTFTRLAMPFLAALRQEMFGKRCMVEVWAENTVSRRWLSFLGFQVEDLIYRNNQPFLVMEYRN